MPLTREADITDATTALFQALLRCADGHKIEDVLNANINFLVAAINESAPDKGAAERLAAAVARDLVDMVSTQWSREPQDSDVTVPENGH